MILALVACAAAAIGPASALGGTRAPAGATGDPARVARALAIRLDRAPTASARYDALLALARAVGLRVYAASGGLVAAGGREQPPGFGIYDVELQAMAQTLRDRPTASLRQLSMLLAGAGIVERGRPLAPSAIRAGLASAARTAVAHGGDAAQLVPLLVRELGVRRNRNAVDLARRRVRPADVRFDVVQTMLVLADVAAGVARRQPAGAPVTLPSANPCADPTVREVLENYGPLGEKIADKLIKRIPYGETGREIVRELVDAIYAGVLASGVKVTKNTAKQANGRSHWGPRSLDRAQHPDAPDAGRKIWLGVSVTFTIDVPKPVIDCGQLLGRKLPRKGPMAGVLIRWNDVNQLRRHGTLAFEPPLQPGIEDTSATNRFGSAWLSLVPHNEPRKPRKGDKILEEDGEVAAKAAYIPASESISADLIRAAVPKAATLRWHISWHECEDRGRAVATSDACERYLGNLSVRAVTTAVDSCTREELFVNLDATLSSGGEPFSILDPFGSGYGGASDRSPSGSYRSSFTDQCPDPLPNCSATGGPTDDEVGKVHVNFRRAGRGRVEVELAGPNWEDSGNACRSPGIGWPSAYGSFAANRIGNPVIAVPLRYAAADTTPGGDRTRVDGTLTLRLASPPSQGGPSARRREPGSRGSEGRH